MIKKILKFFSLPQTVLLIICLAFLLRIAWLNENLFFGYEQGRDLLAIKNIIVNKNLTLLGPKTDADGIFHGPLSYYLLIPSFIVTSGDPLLITISLILVHILSFVLLYKANSVLFGKNTALLSLLFLAISYSSIIYSRWLSNPNLIPAFTIGIYYFLVKAKENNKFLIPVGILWSVVFHLSLISASILVLPILASILVLKIKITPKTFLISLGTALLLLISYPVFELRNDFLISKGIQHLFAGASGKVLKVQNIDQLKNEIVDNLFPLSRTLALVLFAGLLSTAILRVKRNVNYLLPIGFVILPTLFFLVIGINPLRHTYISLPPFIATILACGLVSLKDKLKVVGRIILAVILIGNIWAFDERIPQSIANFLQPSQRTYLGPELRMIDFVYKDAAGKTFNYEYYSIPYWKEEGWRYLFEWYGQKKYGYIPQYKESKTFYVFIEPDERQKLYQQNWYEGMNAKSHLIESKTFDKLTVEKRERY